MKTQFLIVIALAGIIYPCLVTVAYWVAFRGAGLTVKTVAFFRGPRLFTGTLFGNPIEVGCIPIGSSCQWDTDQYDAQPRLLRLGVILAGPAVGLIVAMILLGPAAAVHQVSRAFLQIFVGALSPRTLGVALISHLLTVFEQAPATAIGILVTKVFAYDLIPTGGSAIPQCLVALGNADLRENRIIHSLVILGGLSAIALGASWLLAIISFAITASH